MKHTARINLMGTYCSDHPEKWILIAGFVFNRSTWIFKTYKFSLDSINEKLELFNLIELPLCYPPRNNSVILKVKLMSQWSHSGTNNKNKNVLSGSQMKHNLRHHYSYQNPYVEDISLLFRMQRRSEIFLPLCINDRCMLLNITLHTQIFVRKCFSLSIT